MVESFGASFASCISTRRGVYVLRVVTDHSDQGAKRDRIVEELLRESSIITKGFEDFQLQVPKDLF